MRNSLKHRVLPVLLSLALVMAGVLYAPCVCANTVAAEGGTCCGAEKSSCCAKKEVKKSCCNNAVEATDESASQGSCCTGNCACEMSAKEIQGDTLKAVAVASEEKTQAKAPLAIAAASKHFLYGRALTHSPLTRLHSPPQAPTYLLNCAFLN